MAANQEIFFEETWENSPTDDGQSVWSVEILVGIHRNSYSCHFVGDKPTNDFIANHFKENGCDLSKYTTKEFGVWIRNWEGD